MYNTLLYQVCIKKKTRRIHAENLTGLNCTPKLGNIPYGMLVGERRMRGEVVAKAAVDCIGVRMPE